jgi:hypothetical protein
MPSDLRWFSLPQNAARAAKCRTPHRRSALTGGERLESRSLMAADAHMAVGMNLENVVDWSPAWTFTDALKASRPWIAQAVNTATGETIWDTGAARPLALDANGNVASLATWTDDAGQTIRQMAGTLMFREIAGAYPAGVYRAEWDGTGSVTFGFDTRTIASGLTPEGRHFADLQVTPGSDGIFMRIEATSPADPVRNFNVWMPAWGGRSFVGERWQPGVDFSPFHPLFLQRLAPFKTIRFMGMQETNSSDIRSWSDRRDALDIRQGSGSEGTASEPIVNGMALEYMVQLANDLDADPWFNMPHMADDGFVRAFATYVRDHLEPGRKAYVEWSNEIWNFGWGFEASHWVEERTGLPIYLSVEKALHGLFPLGRPVETPRVSTVGIPRILLGQTCSTVCYAGLDNWQVAGREARRDLDIWTEVFAGRPSRADGGRVGDRRSCPRGARVVPREPGDAGERGHFPDGGLRHRADRQRRRAHEGPAGGRLRHARNLQPRRQAPHLTAARKRISVARLLRSGRGAYNPPHGHSTFPPRRSDPGPPAPAAGLPLTGRDASNPPPGSKARWATPTSGTTPRRHRPRSRN